MGYEIDFIPVGNGEKSGDAIVLRFGNLLTGRREDHKRSSPRKLDFYF